MITVELLEKWQFTHYANTSAEVRMREVYCGMYVSWDWRDKIFRLMPHHTVGFAGIVLPHRTMGEIVTMVAALGGDWCNF